MSVENLICPIEGLGCRRRECLEANEKGKTLPCIIVAGELALRVIGSNVVSEQTGEDVSENEIILEARKAASILEISPSYLLKRARHFVDNPSEIPSE